jgi:hypothetical protein
MSEKVGALVPRLKTKYGRPVYKTKSGGLVSEKSVTLKDGNKFINIPSIHEGIQYSDDEIFDMYKQGKIKATSSHKDIESAEKAAKKRSDKAFEGIDLSKYKAGGFVTRRGPIR